MWQAVRAWLTSAGDSEPTHSVAFVLHARPTGLGRAARGARAGSGDLRRRGRVQRARMRGRVEWRAHSVPTSRRCGDWGFGVGFGVGDAGSGAGAASDSDRGAAPAGGEGAPVHARGGAERGVEKARSAAAQARTRVLPRTTASRSSARANAARRAVKAPPVAASPACAATTASSATTRAKAAGPTRLVSASCRRAPSAPASTRRSVAATGSPTPTTANAAAHGWDSTTPAPASSRPQPLDARPTISILRRAWRCSSGG